MTLLLGAEKQVILPHSSFILLSAATGSTVLAEPRALLRSAYGKGTSKGSSFSHLDVDSNCPRSTR